MGWKQNLWAARHNKIIEKIRIKIKEGICGALKMGLWTDWKWEKGVENLFKNSSKKPVSAPVWSVTKFRASAPVLDIVSAYAG